MSTGRYHGPPEAEDVHVEAEAGRGFSALLSATLMETFGHEVEPSLYLMRRCSGLQRQSSLGNKDGGDE